MSEQRRAYPPDLTDAQWDTIEPFFSNLSVYKLPKRELVIQLYLVQNGCKWRNLPQDFPPYSTMHSFYRRGSLSGIWDKIMAMLVEITRKTLAKPQLQQVVSRIFRTFIEASPCFYFMA